MGGVIASQPSQELQPLGITLGREQSLSLSQVPLQQLLGEVGVGRSRLTQELLRPAPLPERGDEPEGHTGDRGRPKDRHHPMPPNPGHEHLYQGRLTSQDGFAKQKPLQIFGQLRSARIAGTR